MDQTPRHPGARPASSRAAAPPWGRFSLNGFTRALVAATGAVPPWPLIKQLAFPIRRFARLFMGEAVDHVLWGHRLRFHPRGNISERRLLFMPEKWDPAERDLISRHARPGSVFVDIGGNFGGYTWWVLHLLGTDCTALVLEPDPELNERMRFNLATNGFDHVQVLPYAAGDRDGTAVLHIDDRNRGENTLLEEGGGAGREVEVPLRTLASVLDEAQLSRVDVLKIDIEGLEAPVLRAFFDHEPASRWPRLIVCERKDTREHDELEAYLRSRGYALEARTRLNMVLLREPG